MRLGAVHFEGSLEIAMRNLLLTVGVMALLLFDPDVSRLQAASKNPMDAGALISQGNAALDKSDYKQALDCYQQALEAASRTGDGKSQEVVLGNIGNVYYELAQYNMALDYDQMALARAQAIGDRRSEEHDLGNVG